MTGEIPRLAVGKLLSGSWRTICRIYVYKLFHQNYVEKMIYNSRQDKTRQAKQSTGYF